MRRILLILALIQLALQTSAGQEWIVPEDRKGRLSTFPFDENTRTAGQKLYNLNCMSCHGTPGKSNYLNLVPAPGDPATEKIQKNNDGELFFKVTTGRGQMPAFRSVLTTDEVWHIISYLRSFNKSYRQVVRAVISSTAYPGAVINMFIEHNPADTSIVVAAYADSENSRVPVTNAGVKLYVHRTFGHQTIDEEKVTDESGKAVFRITEGLKGDSLGNITVSARFVDEDKFGASSRDTVIAAGIKTIPVSLVADRAMWNTMKKAPLWILVTYTSGVLLALGFIVLVMMKIRDIHILGKYLETSVPDNSGKQ